LYLPLHAVSAQSLGPIWRPASVSASMTHFRDLLSFLRGHSVIWVILASIPNRRGNYRVHLMLVSHHRFSNQPQPTLSELAMVIANIPCKYS
jgi:hypothetical protein